MGHTNSANRRRTRGAWFQPGDSWTMIMLRVPSLLLMFSIAGNVAIATDLSTRSGTSPVLLELFTSEGCSSCPPADAFLLQLDAHQPIAGVQLIVLSEHVDYWNDSWPDPFASGQFTARQADYVRALKARSPYTPQLIVDGATELHLANPNDVSRILQSASASPKIPVSVGSLEVETGNPSHLIGEIGVESSTLRRTADVYIALALDHAQTKVLRGENRGKTLAHVAVVEYLSKVGRTIAGRVFKQNFRVPLRHDLATAGARLVVFVQEPGNGQVVGVILQKITQPR